MKSILRTPREDAGHKSTKDVASILIPCKDKLTMKLIDKAAKLLSCESQPSCLREWEGLVFQGPIIRSSVGKGENNEGVLEQRWRCSTGWY